MPVLAFSDNIHFISLIYKFVMHEQIVLTTLLYIWKLYGQNNVRIKRGRNLFPHLFFLKTAFNLKLTYLLNIENIF